MQLWRQTILALALTTAPAGLVAQTGVAVGGFETDGSVGLTRAEYQALGRAMSALLSARLGQPAQATVVPLASRPGRLDMTAARNAATQAGATVLVVGSLLDQYGDIQLEARIINAATGEPIGVVRGDPKLVRREQLAEAIAALAAKLAAEPRVGATATAGPAGGIPVTALVKFGQGLEAEAAGDRAKAAEAYRAAVAAAPGFSEASTALQRVGG